MVSYEDVESILEEWFCDYEAQGSVALSKLYAKIQIECEKALQFYLGNKESEQK